MATDHVRVLRSDPDYQVPGYDVPPYVVDPYDVELSNETYRAYRRLCDRYGDENVVPADPDIEHAVAFGYEDVDGLTAYLVREQPAA